MNDREYSPLMDQNSGGVERPIEIQLTALYAVYRPDPAFASRLEAQLRERAAQIRDSHIKRQKPGWRLRWWPKPLLAATLIAILLLLAVIVVVGPQRVLAAVQELLGYIPGIGFVDLEGARVLSNPVEVTRDSITFRLEQVIAQEDRTVVKFSIEGLSTIEVEGEEGYLGSFEPRLVLPFGGFYQYKSLQYNADDDSRSGKIEFPAIPAEFDQVWLEFEHLPEVVSNRAPESWQVPVLLKPYTGEITGTNVIRTYQPQAASAYANGVEVQVLQIAQTRDETAVKYRVVWEDQSWNYSGSYQPVLIDDIGHVYREKIEAAGGGLTVEQPPSSIITPVPRPHLDLTYEFPPLSSSARRIRFLLSEVQFTIPVDASFTFDAGQESRSGQTWTIDQWVQIAGVDIRILAARLHELPPSAEEGRDESEYELEFIFEPRNTPAKRIAMLGIQSSADWITGGSASGGSNMQRLSASLIFSRPPRGRMEVTFNEAEVIVNGPWDIPIDLPAEEEGRTAVSYIHPEVYETHHGVTLHLEEVIISDLMIQIDMALSNGEEGMDLARLFSGDEGGEITLADSAGRRFEPYQPIGLAEPFGYDPTKVYFRIPSEENVQSDAMGTLTLNIPAVGIFYPQRETLTIDVPRDVSFHAERQEVSTMIGGREYRATQTRWLSDAWEVDLPMEIAGYHFTFDQARLERDEREFPNIYWLELRGRSPSGDENLPQAIRLRVASIIRPDGRVQTFDEKLSLFGHPGVPYSRIGVEEDGSGEWVNLLRINVTSADGFELQPGQYEINLEGVEVEVPGPWRFTWQVERE